MLNGGIDMFMIPGYRGILAVRDVVNGLKEAHSRGVISDDRLNDAVARILSVKLTLGMANEVNSKS